MIEPSRHEASPVPRKPLWLRIFIVSLLTAGSGCLLVIGLILGIIILWQQSWFQTWVFFQASQLEVNSAQEPPAVPAQIYTGPQFSAAGLNSADQLFIATNIWEAHLKFTSNQWHALGPLRITPVSDWLGRDGTPVLHNPRASRAGIAGVLGWELPTSSGDFEFGGLAFTNTSTRFKGNGTFLAGLKSYRRPFKVDLDKHVPSQQLASRTKINLHNLEADPTCLSDTLAYEFFRDAGVLAPRTTFARLFLTIDNRWERRLLGLYLIVENPDAEWLREHFARDDVALFKPVTQELFEYKGDAWQAYEEVYDPKTKPTVAQQERVLELCRLTTSATDAEFARRIGELLDLAQFARFMACNSLLSNYDSILDNGQNFLVWLDPRTGRFCFGPWDMDQSWGRFPFVGSPDSREKASLFHPWIGKKRFLERVFAVSAFEELYRAELDRMLETLFVPERLNQRIDEVAAAIRPAVAEQSAQRLRQFEAAVLDYSPPAPTEEKPSASQRRAGRGLKGFIARRAQEARTQLEGQSEGVILKRPGG